jgi:hypothetical protein
MARSLSLTALAPVLVSVIAGACLPIPWTEYQQPAVIGQLRFGGQPLSGYPVMLAAPDSTPRCGASLSATVTDSLGQFSLPAQIRRHHFVLLMEWWQAQEWRLCTTVDGHEVALTTQQSALRPVGRMQRRAQVKCTVFRLADTATGLRGSCDIQN